MRIADYLSHGHANAVPLHHLQSMTGLDGRTVRRLIAGERRSGTPILSDNATGYFLPGNDSERMRFVRSMRSRAKEILDAAEAVERARE